MTPVPPASSRALVRAVTSAESAARDAAAIAGGIPSRALMQRAGAAAAAELAVRWPEALRRGALVLTGPGNNGGDGWVVARALASHGVLTRVVEVVDTGTPDARAERALAVDAVTPEPWREGNPWRGEGVIVDALLGTGSTGRPRGSIGEAVSAVGEARARGALVAALDVPTGLDATTGDDEGALTADLTLSFGTAKRGHLVSRHRCGRIVVLDIGLGPHARLLDGAPGVVDETWAAVETPSIPAEAHKGIRKKLVIIGGAEGMAGAVILAARSAMRSGVGMVRAVVSPGSLVATQSAEPFALATAWPRSEQEDLLHREITEWADAVVIGPGLGGSSEARQLAERVLTQFHGPVLLDADGLNMFAGRLSDLASLVGSRACLLTPHPAEFARLAGGACDVSQVSKQHFDIGADVARRAGATVLLKGVPTVVTAPDGRRLVSASGNAALAAAGSGDILSGIAGTLLAQTGDALVAGALGAWAHGRAAELAAAAPSESARPGQLRGVTLSDVLDAVRLVWRPEAPQSRYPVLLELPSVGDAS